MELKIIEASKAYKKNKALNCFSMELKKGIYGLLGPNGAGKTTLIKSLVGIHKLDSGKIIYNNKEVDVDFLKLVGYIPQMPQFYPNYTGYEMMDYIATLKGIASQLKKAKIEKLLETVNLTKYRNIKISNYSGGMKQRLGIAQALLNDPEVLVCDEPTAGLDPLERLHFKNTISRLKTRCIVIICTHIISDLENIADEVILINEGTNIKQIKVNELLEEVSSKVWNVKSSKELEGDYLISRIQFENDIYTTRIISEEKPHKNAEKVVGDLEDVYLYFFGLKS